ncbi:MAG: LamG domain-containing protein, partial [Candidatus Diapherotrites archaeon]
MVLDDKAKVTTILIVFACLILLLSFVGAFDLFGYSGNWEEILEGSKKGPDRIHFPDINSKLDEETAKEIIYFAGYNPKLDSISASVNPIDTGNTQTVTSAGQTDKEGDTLYFYCCKDNANTCTPTAAETICTGGDTSHQESSGTACSYVYAAYTCTYPVGSTDGTEYVRCNLWDGTTWSNNSAVCTNTTSRVVVSASYTVDDVTIPTASCSSCPTSGYVDPFYTFTLNENGDCKIDDADSDYDTADSGGWDCTGDGGTSITCSSITQTAGTSVSYYVACKDSVGNKDTVETNLSASTYEKLGPQPPDMNLNLPNGGETISYAKDGNYTIDFNVMDADGDVLTADIYYSSGAGEFENLIASDVNLVNASAYFGLVGWWRMDDGAGTTAVDSSGSGNNGTLTNFDCTTLDCDSNSGWVSDGKYEQGISFNGNNDYVNVASSSDFDTSTGTISFWLKRADDMRNDAVMHKVNGANSFIAMASVTTFAVYFYIDGVKYSPGSCSINPGTTAWHHYAVTQDGSGIKTYYDGRDCNTTNTDTKWLGDFPDWGLTIGKGFNEPGAVNRGSYVAGKLDDVAIFNRGFSAAEIQALFQTSCQDMNFSDSTRCFYSWDVGGIADGNYYVDVNIADTLDANKYDSSDNLFQIDNTAPVVTVVSLAGDAEAPYVNPVINSDTNLLLSISDFNIAGVNCKWDSSNAAYASLSNSCTKSGIQYNCEFGSLAGDSYTYYYACQDYGENTSTTTSLDFTVALNAAPDVNVISPNGYETYNYNTDGNVVFDFNVSDAQNDDLNISVYYSTTSGIANETKIADVNLALLRDGSLMLWWGLDEGTGTTATDLSGNGNNGTLADAMAYTSGKFGQALQGATNDYVSG